MSKSTPAMILETYCGLHRFILEYAGKLSQEQLSWQAQAETLSAAFFLWHMGRWADHIQAAIPGMAEELSRRLPPGRQIWESEGLAARWGIASIETGYAETGMHMDEKTAARLRFPPKEVLLDYVSRSFAAAEAAVQAIDDDLFLQEEQPQPLTEGVWSPGGTIGGAIFEHVIHDSRHLGMIEILVGLQSGAGSATG